MLHKPRDPARILPLMEEITKFMCRNPDIRLGQLISNLLPHNCINPFYIEDEYLTSKLRSLNESGVPLKKLNNNNQES